MQAGRLIDVRTDPATQFTAALAQNAALTLNMTAGVGIGFVDWGLAAGTTVAARLRSICIQSVENLAWEVWLWGKDTFNGSATDPALNFPWGSVVFATGDAVRFAAAGLYYYYRAGLDVPYLDLDNTSELHVMLVNRSASGKTANAGGAIEIQFLFEPSLGW